MASAIFFLDSQGKPLLHRDYRGDIPLSMVDHFPRLLDEAGDAAGPCLTRDGVSYVYITHENVYVLALTKKNSNAMALLHLLHRIVAVLRESFKEVVEESVRDNFVVVYELLDEMVDFGHPQITDARMLQEYVTQESHAHHGGAMAVTTTDKVAWRPDNILYKKNELFLDVIESYDAVLNADGSVVRQQISGRIECNAYLSGMPVLQLGLNDETKKRAALGGSDADAQLTARRKAGAKYVELEGVKFHQAVQLDEFEENRNIKFIPPDGKFELMSYRVKSAKATRPLFLVDADVDVRARSRVIVTAKLKSQYRRRLVATTVDVAIPVPQDADTPRFRTNAGTVVYSPERSAIVWRLKNFAGGHDATMKAELRLPSVTGGDSGASDAWRGPVQLKFEIPYLAVSGIQVRYLKVDEPRLKYSSLPWVRYISKNGEEYSVRPR